MERLNKVITHSVTLYIFTAIVWGSTWFAITFQLGEVAPEISLAYRLGLSAVIMLLYCWYKRLPMQFSMRQHLYIMLQGLFLFSLNYLLVYYITLTLPSGQVAVIFSTFVFMNTVNAAIFFKSPIRLYVVLGTVIGFSGISLIFWPELAALKLSSSTLQSAILGVVAAYLASLGNMVALRNQKEKLPVMQTNAYSMVYGTLLLLLWVIINGIPFKYEMTFSYTASLLYLSLFGTVLAFGAYMTLISRIGLDLTSYVVILFPAIALGLSTIFENYHWTLYSIIGVMLVLGGNLLIISKGKLLTFVRNTFESLFKKNTGAVK